MGIFPVFEDSQVTHPILTADFVVFHVSRKVRGTYVNKVTLYVNRHSSESKDR